MLYWSICSGHFRFTLSTIFSYKNDHNEQVRQTTQKSKHLFVTAVFYSPYN